MKEKNFYKKHITFFSRKIPFALFLFTFLFIFLFTFSCTPIGDSSDDNGTSNEVTEGNETEESVNGDDNQNSNADESLSDEGNDAGNEQSDGDDSEETQTGEITINVYYADNMGEYLVGEARMVSSENKYVDALSELMKLPVDSSLYQLVPESTVINSIIVENGLAKVDFSNEFLEDRIQSDTVDILLIYSIVNTLTEFSEVNSVSFYIDGEKLDILGELDIKEPIFRRNDLIK